MTVWVMQLLNRVQAVDLAAAVLALAVLAAGFPIFSIKCSASFRAVVAAIKRVTDLTFHSISRFNHCTEVQCFLNWSM